MSRVVQTTTWKKTKGEKRSSSELLLSEMHRARIVPGVRRSYYFTLGPENATLSARELARDFSTACVKRCVRDFMAFFFHLSAQEISWMNSERPNESNHDDGKCSVIRPFCRRFARAFPNHRRNPRRKVRTGSSLLRVCKTGRGSRLCPALVRQYTSRPCTPDGRI